MGIMVYSLLWVMQSLISLTVGLRVLLLKPLLRGPGDLLSRLYVEL